MHNTFLFFQKIIEYISSITNGYLFLFVLLGVGLFFTLYLKFPQKRYFVPAIKLLLKNNSNNSNGDTSRLQTIATSLAGSIGVGSITGVGIAIHIGGPSSLLWIIITAFLGMATSFAEVAMSHHYREKSYDNTMAGGPMYYISKGLNLRYLALMAAIFTILSALGAGNLTQSNSIANTISFSFKLKQVWVGLTLSLLIGVIIIGGIKRIGLVAEKLVPTISILYLIISLFVLIANYSNILPSICLIFKNFWNPSSAIGGFMGSTLALSMQSGIMRSFFCSAAGSGAIGITHAASMDDNTYNESLISILEPFISTIIMCTLTGIVILSTGNWKKKFVKIIKSNETEILSLINKNKINIEKKLSNHILNKKKNKLFTGQIQVKNGKIITNGISIINSKSIVEDIFVLKRSLPYNGTIEVKEGIFYDKNNIIIRGKALLSAKNLASSCFKKSILGSLGSKFMAICLVVFAFTTIMAYYYFGNRALIFLGATDKIISGYKVTFIIILFLGSITHADLVWALSDIAYALMAIPNLIGLILSRKKIKSFAMDNKAIKQLT